MIIKDVIDRVEKQCIGCNMSLEEYLSVINILEQDIFTNIIATHENTQDFLPHAVDTETLLVPDMYADLYSFWILARIDLANGDTVGYANNMILYNNLMSEFAGYYTRNHMPRAKGRVRWY